MRGKNTSLTFMNSDPALPPATDGKGHRGLGISPNPRHHTADEGQGHISHLYVLCLIHLNLVSEISSTALPSRGVRPTSLNVVAGKGEGQLLYSPQVAGKKK